MARPVRSRADDERLLAAAVVGLLASAVRIVPEYQRLAVFRLGRCIGARGPGLVLLIPVIDRGVRVDLREIYLDVPPGSTSPQSSAHRGATDTGERDHRQ